MSKAGAFNVVHLKFNFEQHQEFNLKSIYIMAVDIITTALDNI